MHEYVYGNSVSKNKHLFLQIRFIAEGTEAEQLQLLYYPGSSRSYLQYVFRLDGIVLSTVIAYLVIMGTIWVTAF